MAKDIGNRQPQLRQLIAQKAARMMAEEGISDYAFAKKKAGRQLGIVEMDCLPTNAEIEEEIKLYAPFLDRQIQIIQPKVIVMLGRHSMNYIFKKAGIEDKLQPISKMHGELFEGNFGYGPVSLLPLYHPAAAIYNQHLLDTLKEDFKLLKDLS